MDLNTGRTIVGRMGVALILLASLMQVSASAALAASASPTPVTSSIPASCKKVYVEVVNADKVYVALQYGVVKAATDYEANQSFSNKLIYNDSHITAIQAANRELNFAISNPQCYPAKNITGYIANVKSNLAQITNIRSANINGQLVGDPKKMMSFKPVGLLH
jgi:P pilus assembly chaperone PapD